MSDSPVNLNTATAEKLQTLPGIGPVLAKAIVEYRNENGLFESVDELVNVSGMTKAKIAAIAERIVIEGSQETVASTTNTQPPSPEKKQPITPELLEKWKDLVDHVVCEIAENTGEVEGFGSQIFQVGRLVDMWSTLIDGFGKEELPHRMAFQTKLKAYDLTGYQVDKEVKELQATGLFAPTRKMLFFQRKHATVTVYFAIQNEALYISWRAFLKAMISWVRVVFVVLLVLLFAALSAIETETSWRGGVQTHFNWETFFGGIFIIGIVLALLSMLWGYLYREGDYLAFYRVQFSEFQVDDVMSLIYGVHHSIMDAATVLGVDIAKLEKYEPFCTPKNRVRGRF